jgi:hypothetical protein
MWLPFTAAKMRAVANTKAYVGGTCGKLIKEALLNTGKHTLTALTREGSEAKLPDGVSVRKIDYGKPETLVEALRGQHALVITLSGRASKEAQEQLIDAAGEAGVGWIFPNEWSPDIANEALIKGVSVFQSKGEHSSFQVHSQNADGYV